MQKKDAWDNPNSPGSSPFRCSDVILDSKVYCKYVKYPASIVCLCHKCFVTTFERSLQYTTVYLCFGQCIKSGHFYLPNIISASVPQIESRLSFTFENAAVV